MHNITSPNQTVNKKDCPVLPALSAPKGVEGVGSPSCLFSNNSIEHPESGPIKLSSYHKKQAQTLYSNVDRLVRIESRSIDYVAFLTLTFQENIKDHKQAYDRFRSFNSNFLASHQIYGQWISVKEHQARGAWHFHMIIQLTEDIRTGFDFDQYDDWLKGPRKKGTFPTGNAQLRSLWAELDSVLPDYGFGRIFTLEPIKSNAEAVSRYVGKYVSKQIGQRPESDKGVRLINYSKGWVKNSVNMAWFNENSKLWRKKVAIFARIHGCQELYQLSEKLGSDWAYKYTQEIVEIEIVPPRFEEDCYGKERTFKSPTLESIKDHKQAREKKLVKNLTLHSGKSVAEQKREETKIKLGKISKDSVKSWITPEITEKIKADIQADRQESPFRETKRINDQLQRSIQGGKDLPPNHHIIKNGPSSGEIIPF